MHPEQVCNTQGVLEFFLGNFEQRFIDSILKKNWKKLRVGLKAYDENGQLYSEEILESVRPKPVFVDRTEAILMHNKSYGEPKQIA